MASGTTPSHPRIRRQQNPTWCPYKYKCHILFGHASLVSEVPTGCGGRIPDESLCGHTTADHVSVMWCGHRRTVVDDKLDLLQVTLDLMVLQTLASMV